MTRIVDVFSGKIKMVKYGTRSKIKYSSGTQKNTKGSKKVTKEMGGKK